MFQVPLFFIHLAVRERCSRACCHLFTWRERVQLQRYSRPNCGQVTWLQRKRFSRPHCCRLIWLVRERCSMPQCSWLIWFFERNVFQTLLLPAHLAGEGKVFQAILLSGHLDGLERCSRSHICQLSVLSLTVSVHSILNHIINCI